MLNKEELERYKRQITIPSLGEAGQLKLKNRRIFVAGAGGLGSSASLYLAAAGIGCLRLVDSDRVELSNLNRQIMHYTQDIGREKTISGSEKLKALNPNISIETIQNLVSADNVENLVHDCDGILDATDNLETRYLLNKTAVKAGLPLFHGAVSGFEGRVLTVLPGTSACLMCLYHGVSMYEKTPVLGVTPGIIGCIQATEVIKYITGIGNMLIDRLLIYDGLNMDFREIHVTRNPECPHCSNGSR